MRLDGDTGALVRRQHLNARGELHNLDDWIVRHARPAPGMRVLDLGCGTGKQTFRLAQEVAPGGSVIALDKSPTAVDHVNRFAQKATSHSPAVHAMLASFDDRAALRSAGSFDLIHSTYAVYYSSDVVTLLQGLKMLLNPGGRLFVCGPGVGTNAEFLEIVNEFVDVAAVSDFLSASQVATIAGTYRATRNARLRNVIRFESVSTLMAWWRHHNSYIPAVASKVQARLQDHFAEHSDFRLTKNVLGVRFDT